MGWKAYLARVFVGMLDVNELWDLSGEAIRRMSTRVSPAERAAYLHRLAEGHLEELLSGMEREERAELMNGLLPVLEREFPLEELDVLGAFFPGEE